MFSFLRFTLLVSLAGKARKTGLFCCYCYVLCRVSFMVQPLKFVVFSCFLSDGLWSCAVLFRCYRRFFRASSTFKFNLLSDRCFGIVIELISSETPNANAKNHKANPLQHCDTRFPQATDYPINRTKLQSLIYWCALLLQ